jgi:hypothetical protein
MKTMPLSNRRTPSLEQPMPRPAPPLVALAVVTLLVTLAAAPAGAQATTSYSLAGSSVAIYNLAGEVTVRAGTGPSVTVAVTPGGADGGELKIVTGDLRGRPTLRVLYPDTRIVYRPMGRGSNTEFSIREDGTWGSENGHGREGDRRIRVRGDGSGTEASAAMVVSVPAGRAVAIFLGVGRMDVTGVDGELRLDAASANVSTRSTRGRLDIDTGSGDVEVRDADGVLHLDTGSGDVTLAGVRGDRHSIDTGSGDVRATTVASRELSIDTGSGDVTGDGVTAPRISVETGSGSVRLAMLGELSDLDVDAGSGDVTLTLPAGFGATLDLESGSGDFDLGFPVELIRRSEGELHGRVGDGRSRLHVETGSGDVALRQ